MASLRAVVLDQVLVDGGGSVTVLEIDRHFQRCHQSDDAMILLFAIEST